MHRVIGDKFLYGVIRSKTKYMTENGDYCVKLVAISTPVVKNNQNTTKI